MRGSVAVQKTSQGLPRRVPPEARTRAHASTTDSRAATDPPRWRIAVVDDDATWLELVKLGLAHRGYRVETFERGHDFLDSPTLRCADLVVLDYHLPDIDGLSLCEAIHRTRPALRTVLCTGEAETGVVVAALREGLNDYLVKPVAMERLDACIRRLLDDGQRERTLRRRARLHLDSGKMIPGTPYRLDAWIGEGGMGTVYRGTHVAIERRVAIKVLHLEHCVREASVRTFRNEARASARIGAPNIVDIFDFAELDDGRLLIAMEYLEGTALDQVLRAEKVAVERLIPIARQICRGLAAAHDAGIVHRDIKPANVMLVQRDGRADFVKLVDFGIAAFQSEYGGAQPLAGTPHYMAPESIQFGTVDARVDEYALGCLLYEWAAGTPPFGGSTDDILLAQIERPPPPFPPPREIPEPLERVIRRCLAKQPDDRHGSMREVEAALCEAQIALGIRTEYDDLPLPEIDDARRRDLAARMPHRANAPVTSRRRRLVSVMGGVVLLALAGLGWVQRNADANEHDVPTDVHDRMQEARLAASRFYFVYPPLDDPDAPTAYSEIAALEQMQTEAATEAAGVLRREFAETLVRLGDRYWTFEHGRGFAREYYAMARLFDPGHLGALERAALTPTMLAELRARAAQREFVEGELAAVEPLLALAEDDPVARSQKLEELQQDPSQPSTVVHRIAQLEQERSHASPTHARRPTTERTRPSAQPAAIAQDTPSAADRMPPPRPRARRAVSSHLRMAERARGSGQLQEAETHYHRAIDADPDDPRALDGLAAMYYDAGEYQKSLRYARLATARGAPNARRYIALGDAYFKVLRYSDALAAYQRAEQLGSLVAGGRVAKVRGKLGKAQSR